MATPTQSIVKTIAAIVQWSSREKAVNWRRWVDILILPSVDSRTACRLERLRRRHLPAYRDGIARRIGEAKRIQTMERAVVKPGRKRLALDDRQRLDGFGMACEKRSHSSWISLARSRV